MKNSEKKTIAKFNEDVKIHGGYLYANSTRLSARLAMERISQVMSSLCDFDGKKVIDVGCGDGTYTKEILNYHPGYLLGVDEAELAIESARKKYQSYSNIQFRVMDIYQLPSLQDKFDIAVARGILHHLTNPTQAIAALCQIAKEIIVIEPNGYSPALKIIEKVSPYHREHHEKSYFPFQLRQWFARCGGQVAAAQYCCSVPMFCPDWLAATLKFFEPVLEGAPGLKHVNCSSYIFKIKTPL